MHKPYVYVLVREDLPVEQQLVQVSHAALEAGFRFQQPEKTASLIVLSVPNEAGLKEAAERLARYDIDHHMFFEPDFGPMGYSALATRPLLDKKERHRMRKWPLYQLAAQGA